MKNGEISVKKIKNKKDTAETSFEIRILRKKRNEHTQYWQTFLYSPKEENETVATALKALNDMEDLKDVEGHEAEPVIWENSCLQKKCGACAMVINGCPGLACDTRLSDLKKPVILEPLHKFPVAADLMVNREVMFQNLTVLEAWLNQQAAPAEGKNHDAHEASICLQCGCCLEVCPNYASDGSFFGMAAMVPASRVLIQMSEEEKSNLKDAYKKHIYEGCGKSLACQNICPAGINIQGLMARSNAAAVWKLFSRLRKKS